MESKTKFGVVLSFLFLLAVLTLPRVSAQEGEVWSPPSRLSSQGVKASPGYLVADQFGYVHLFWTETLLDERIIIQYSRFDGESWSKPFDIHVTPPFAAVENISSFVDHNGMLHLMWSESDNGPAFYTRAPAYNAMSAQFWHQPIRIDIPAKSVNLLVDSRGVFHVLFAKLSVHESGVYYLRSEDQGMTWTDAIWLDPDILPDHYPRSVQFSIDSTDGLHASWYYSQRDGMGGDWVRYTHSLDGGNTWSLPFTIDKLVEGDEETGKRLSAAEPVMIVNDQTVHIIWAGGEQHYRNHRYSEDAGLTWSDPLAVFFPLNGQAFDGMTLDGNGRVHYFAQIRYPQGIYHSVWDNGKWSAPSLIYLIQNGPQDEIGDRIHAHHVHPAVRAGNQLVLTFADPPPEPERRLFAMTMQLEDVRPAQPEATPAPTATFTPLPSPTARPEATATPISSPVDFSSTPLASATPGSALWYALIPALVLLGGVFVIRMLTRSRH